MHLAPLEAALRAMFALLPPAITEKLDCGAVHEQVQGAIGAPTKDLDRQSFLPKAQGGAVVHRTVQVANFCWLATKPVV
jgi:hypothetical protein